MLLLEERLVLFKKLIKQHRVHCVVTYRVNLAFGVASDEIGIHFCHLLSHKAKLRNAIGINLLLVTESDRFERQDRFTCLVHRLDLVLETLRGGCHAQLTERIYNNWCACNGYPTDCRDKGLKLAKTDAQGTGLASKARRADVDIATTRGEIEAGRAPQCDVTIAGVVQERLITDSHVVVAGGIVKKCTSTKCDITAACYIVIEGLPTSSDVAAADDLAEQRESTVGRG